MRLTIEQIEKELQAHLPTDYILVKDESHQHADHNADAALGGTHFSVLIVSKAFEGVLPVKRHQKVYTALGDAFNSTTLHALQITALTPKQWQEKQNNAT
jgi:BolA protein